MIPTPPIMTATHEVLNQARPLENYNAYASNLPLQEAVRQQGAGWAHEWLMARGAEVGSAEWIERRRVPVRTPCPFLNSFFASPSTVRANSEMIFAPLTCMVRFSSSPFQSNLRSDIECLHHDRDMMLDISTRSAERVLHDVHIAFDRDHILCLDRSASGKQQDRGEDP